MGRCGTRRVEEDGMATSRESVLIEITEDAYKQNSVYRPWEEIKMDGATARTRSSLPAQQAPNTLTTARAELSTVAMQV